eukprot:2145109-Alexandrium_andersonii.AAC.1
MPWAAGLLRLGGAFGGVSNRCRSSACKAGSSCSAASTCATPSGHGFADPSRPPTHCHLCWDPAVAGFGIGAGPLRAGH